MHMIHVCTSLVESSLHADAIMTQMSCADDIYSFLKEMAILTTYK